VERDGAVDVGEGVGGIEVDGLVVGGDGLLVLMQSAEGVALGEVGFGGGVEMDGAGGERERVLIVACLTGDEAEEIKGGGVVGGCGEDLAVKSFGLGKLAGAVVGQSLLELAIEHIQDQFSTTGNG